MPEQKAPAPAEPVTAKAVENSAELEAPAIPVPGVPLTTEKVVTGKHILTGKDVVKERPVKKPAPTYNTGDRLVYTVHTAITGSLAGRKFDLQAGDTVNLNADESKLLAPYVTKVN